MLASGLFCALALGGFFAPSPAAAGPADAGLFNVPLGIQGNVDALGRDVIGYLTGKSDAQSLDKLQNRLEEIEKRFLSDASVPSYKRKQIASEIQRLRTILYQSRRFFSTRSVDPRIARLVQAASTSADAIQTVSELMSGLFEAADNAQDHPEKLGRIFDNFGNFEHLRDKKEILKSLQDLRNDLPVIVVDASGKPIPVQYQGKPKDVTGFHVHVAALGDSAAEGGPVSSDLHLNRGPLQILYTAVRGNGEVFVQAVSPQSAKPRRVSPHVTAMLGPGGAVSGYDFDIAELQNFSDEQRLAFAREIASALSSQLQLDELLVPLANFLRDLDHFKLDGAVEAHLTFDSTTKSFQFVSRDRHSVMQIVTVQPGLGSPWEDKRLPSLLVMRPVKVGADGVSQPYRLGCQWEYADDDTRRVWVVRNQLKNRRWVLAYTQMFEEVYLVRQVRYDTEIRDWLPSIADEKWAALPEERVAKKSSVLVHEGKTWMGAGFSYVMKPLEMFATTAYSGAMGAVQWTVAETISFEPARQAIVVMLAQGLYLTTAPILGGVPGFTYESYKKSADKILDPDRWRIEALGSLSKRALLSQEAGQALAGNLLSVGARERLAQELRAQRRRQLEKASYPLPQEALEQAVHAPVSDQELLDFVRENHGASTYGKQLDALAQECQGPSKWALQTAGFIVGSTEDVTQSLLNPISWVFLPIARFGGLSLAVKGMRKLDAVAHAGPLFRYGVKWPVQTAYGMMAFSAGTGVAGDFASAAHACATRNGECSQKMRAVVDDAALIVIFAGGHETLKEQAPKAGLEVEQANLKPAVEQPALQAAAEQPKSFGNIWSDLKSLYQKAKRENDKPLESEQLRLLDVEPKKWWQWQRKQPKLANLPETTEPAKNLAPKESIPAMEQPELLNTKAMEDWKMTPEEMLPPEKRFAALPEPSKIILPGEAAYKLSLSFVASSLLQQEPPAEKVIPPLPLKTEERTAPEASSAPQKNKSGASPEGKKPDTKMASAKVLRGESARGGSSRSGGSSSHSSDSQVSESGGGSAGSAGGASGAGGGGAGGGAGPSSAAGVGSANAARSEAAGVAANNPAPAEPTSPSLAAGSPASSSPVPEPSKKDNTVLQAASIVGGHDHSIPYDNANPDAQAAMKAAPSTSGGSRITVLALASLPNRFVAKKEAATASAPAQAAAPQMQSQFSQSAPQVADDETARDESVFRLMPLTKYKRDFPASKPKDGVPFRRAVETGVEIGVVGAILLLLPKLGALARLLGIRKP